MEYGASRHLRQVMLSDIDLLDRSCCISANRNPEALRQAVAADGLLNPPVLCFDEAAGRFRIVCGYLRMEVLPALGRREIPAWVLPPGSRPAELLGCALRDNLSHRILNPVEKAAAVVRLRMCLSVAEIVETWLPRLELRPALSTLAEAEALNALEPEVQDGLVQGHITERAALRLARMEASDRRALWSVLARVRLSASKQTELIESCRDIARRDGCSVADVVVSEEVRGMLADKRHSAAQRGEHVRRHIRRRRFPRLVRRERRFAALRAGLDLPANIALHAPAGFEGDTYRIDIAFTRPEQLRHAARCLEALAGHAGLPEILDNSG